MTITVCIPQGSISGPLLFHLLLMIFPLWSRILMFIYLLMTPSFLYWQSNSIYQYLDDHDISKISSCLKNNRLIMSTDKSRSILFATNQRQCNIDSHNFKLYLDDVTLPRVHEIKILGVHFKHILSFKPIYLFFIIEYVKSSD